VVEIGPASPSLPWRPHYNHDAGLGGVRALRPGGYAEYVVVEASAAAAVPADVDPLEMAALGLASVTAFEGLRKIGDLESRRIVGHRCCRWRRLGRGGDREKRRAPRSSGSSLVRRGRICP